MFLKNAWYQAGWSEELPEGEMLGRRLLDEPVLLFRDERGEARALEDMCPHRFAPLSKGRISNGRVACGYHGMTFDGAGQCVHNPHGPAPARASVRSFPLVERHCALWIWMGEADRADPATIPDLSFIDAAPPVGRGFGYMAMRASYLLLTDNILDLSHADYLHPTTLGGVITGSKMTIEERGDAVFVHWWSADVQPPPFLSHVVPPGDRVDVWTEVLWSAPAVMALRTNAVPAGTPRPPEDSETALHSMTPETATTSHYFFNLSSRVATDSTLIAGWKSSAGHVFETEDKPMLEAQQERMGDRDFWSMRPALLGIDGASVRARRKLEQLIAEERLREDRAESGARQAVQA